MDQVLRPIPIAGRATVTPLSSDNRFSLTCADLSLAERDLLMGFFMQMQGRFGAFRFECGAAIFPVCRFDSDTGPSMASGPGPHRLTFPIKVLHAYSHMRSANALSSGPITSP